MDQRVQTICLVVISSVLAAGAMYWLRPVLIPFVLAVFISLGLSTLIDAGTRRGIPRALTLLGALGFAGLFFAGVAALISASIAQLAENASLYQEKATQLLELVLAAAPFDISEGGGAEAVARLPVGTLGTFLMGTTNAIADILSKSFLVSIFVLYLVIGRSTSPPPSAGVWSEIEQRVTRYLVTKAMISGATGVLVGLTLALLGVDLALVFGFMAFLLNFIPSIGSVVATLLPLPVVLASGELTTTAAVLAIAVPGVIQITIGNLVEPRIMGDHLDLHPVVILIALISWGMLWGVVGMLLATPMTAVLKILLDRFEPSRPLAELLAGRFASAEP